MKKNIKYIILGLLVIMFSVLLALILTNKIINFDNIIYDFVTIFKNDLVTSIYKVITFFGSTLFVICLCIVFLVILWKNKKGLLISICLAGSTLINNAIKLIVRRERPLDLMLVEENTFSFPSGHTMASVSMYGFLIYLIWKSNFSKKLKIILTIILSILTLAIALSRIYLGAHYASDIIGAIIVSSIWLMLFISFIEHKKLI